MDKLEKLGALDRATLTAWRVTNTVGWWIVCFVVAGLLRLAQRSAFERLAERNVFPHGIAAAGLHLPFALATAFAVGGIAGSRIWRDQARIALITLLITLAPEVWDGSVVASIPSAVAIPVGYLWAKRIAGRRRV